MWGQGGTLPLPREHNREAAILELAPEQVHHALVVSVRTDEPVGSGRSRTRTLDDIPFGAEPHALARLQHQIAYLGDSTPVPTLCQFHFVDRSFALARGRIEGARLQQFPVRSLRPRRRVADGQRLACRLTAVK